MNIENVGLCNKDLDWKVVFQNNFCKKICGDMVGTKCQELCYRLFDSKSVLSKVNHGIYNFNKKIVKEKSYDFAIAFNDDQILTVICPIEFQEKTKNFLKEKGLSKRELEVFFLKSQGYKNIEIEKKLNISHSTVKTHITTIRRKLGLRS